MSNFRLYEIDAMLRDALEAAEQTIDPETGEIPADWAAFLDDVQMERDKKCLAVAAYIRECMTEAEAVKTETKRLALRARTAENKAERLKMYLAGTVQTGEKLKNTWVSIGWRKSEAVVIDDETAIPEAYWRIHREVSKAAVKDALASGELTAGAHIEAKNNIQVR